MYIFCALKGTAIRILRFVAFRTNLSIYGTQRKTVPLLYIASTENRRNYCRYRQFIWVGQALTPKGGPINRPHGSSCLSGDSACKSSSNSAIGQPPGEKKWHWERQDMNPSGMERYGKIAAMKATETAFVKEACKKTRDLGQLVAAIPRRKDCIRRGR